MLCDHQVVFQYDSDELNTKQTERTIKMLFKKAGVEISKKEKEEDDSWITLTFNKENCTPESAVKIADESLNEAKKLGVRVSCAVYSQEPAILIDMANSKNPDETFSHINNLYKESGGRKIIDDREENKDAVITLCFPTKNEKNEFLAYLNKEKENNPAVKTIEITEWYNSIEIFDKNSYTSSVKIKNY